MKRYYCTYFDRNYLIKALALIESLNKHEKNDFQLFAICMDEITRVILNKLNLPHVTTIPVHDIEQRDFALLETKKNRSIVEYYWTATPTILLRLLERNPEIDILTYLDADLFFFSSPDPIFEELGDNSILIHGHRFSPSLAYLEKESGKYNVGLLAFRNDSKGLDALSWWRERCLEWCYWRYEDGKMGDQMYLNDWPERFTGVEVLKNIGAAVAPWNHEQYNFSIDNKQRMFVNDQPLIFYHFQFLGFVAPDIIIPSKHLTYPLTKDIIQLCFLPYIYSLSRGIELSKTILSDFNFGLSENNILTSRHTFIAHKEMSEVLKKSGIQQIRLQLDDRWDCYCSEQMKDFSTIFSCKDTGIETLTLWPDSKSVKSEDDLLLELTGKPITKEIRFLYVVGAHIFQERELFFKIFPNLSKVYLFEPIPELYVYLKDITKEDQKIEVFPYALSDTNGKVQFYVTDNLASSSLLPLGKHIEIFPHVKPAKIIEVESITLDNIIAQYNLFEPDMLFLDVQGAEYKILSSLSPSLRSRIRLIYTEASKEELYVGSKSLEDLKSLLKSNFLFLGFAPLTNETLTHGNALFVNHHDKKLVFEFDQFNEQHVSIQITEEIEKINNFLESGKLEDANKSLKQAIKRYPDSPDLHNLEAVLKMSKGDNEGAKAIFFEIIKRWPKHYAAYNNLACIFWNFGDFENAVKYFEDALRISNFDRSVVMSFGDMLMNQKKFGKAKEIFETYLKTNPNDSEIHSLLQKTEGVLEKVKSLTQVVEKLKD